MLGVLRVIHHIHTSQIYLVKKKSFIVVIFSGIEISCRLSKAKKNLSSFSLRASYLHYMYSG